ncbi:MAG: hypothetical protein Q4D88_00805 [Anaerococcus sp.]|nr:hypothetical protein [Anaerococcus sp.]
MKIQKKKIVILLSMMCIFILSTGLTYAKTLTLAWKSNYTYVRSYHPDNFTADTYTGYLSIRGADRYGTNGSSYPNYSRITYVKDGIANRYKIHSQGESDTKVRTRQVTFKDDWDFGPKTEVYGFIATSQANATISSVNDEY